MLINVSFCLLLIYIRPVEILGIIDRCIGDVDCTLLNMNFLNAVSHMVYVITLKLIIESCVICQFD